MKLNKEIEMIADTISKAVPAEKIYLFGSYAYGTPHKNSDYDFFVVVPDGEIKPMEAMRKARFAIFPLNLTNAVDVIANYKSDFEERKKQISLEQIVDQQGVLLFERK
ncbi:MAG: nucleotidyltransferase domain-containing protein [Oscillospiraceae bacterium]|nr:nucleotidyltransferase domain-containing protein [Oscillospiraceae bacterium]